MTDKLLPVVELFGPTIQGEGALAGQVSYFVRFGGCSFKCSWCDSMHAVDPKRIKAHAKHLNTLDILVHLASLHDNEVERGLHPWVTITGGDPCIHDLTELVLSLKSNGYRIAVETQGAIWRDWLTACDLVTVSPKGPSSGMSDKFELAGLLRFQHALFLPGQFVLKFVIFMEEDLKWAKAIRCRFDKPRIFLSVGTPLEGFIEGVILQSYRWLVDKVLADPFWHDATVLPQLHTLLWGRELGR